MSVKSTIGKSIGPDFLVTGNNKIPGYFPFFFVRKFRPTAENKQTFGLTGKIQFEGKNCQNAENKQTFDLTGKIEIEGKNSSKR